MSLSEEQKKLRSTGFGASEIATIIGVSPGSLIELWDSKVNPRFDEDDAGLAAKLGNVLEDGVAQVYAEQTKTLLAPSVTFGHPTRPLILATPDRARFMNEAALHAALALGVNERGQLTNLESFAHAERGVEIKTHAARYRRDYGPDGTGIIPEYEAVQVTIQMGITGLRVVDLPVLFRGDYGVTLATFTASFNENLFGWLCDEAERFWRDFVETKKPPPSDGSERYDEALARMYPADRKPPSVADETDERLMLDYAKFRELARRTEVLKKKLGQDLKLRIGEAGGLMSPTLGKLSWTRSKDSTEVDWQRAAQDALALGGLCLNAFDTLKTTGEPISDENRAVLEARLKAIVPDATKTKPGYRSLRFYPKKGSEADLELARLSMALDALDSGEPT